MFQYFSILSPNGTPEQAALVAAQDAPFEWETKDGQWLLRVGEIKSPDLVFYFRKDALFIQEATKTVRVALPPENVKSFTFEPINEDGRAFTSMSVAVPLTPGGIEWTDWAGKTIDLREKDAHFFTKKEGGALTLPAVITEKEDHVRVGTPKGFLRFLKNKFGDLRCEVEELTGGRDVLISISAGPHRFTKSHQFDLSTDITTAQRPNLILADGYERQAAVWIEKNHE